MSKRALLNFIVSVAYQILTLVIGLILPKYYTEGFGSLYNGLNQSVSQIMSLLSVLQLGIAAAAVQQMFKHIATQDEQGISDIYYASGRQYRKMGVIFIIVLLPIILLFPHVIKDNLDHKIIIIFLLIRSVSAAMEYFFQAKYSVIMIAQNRSYMIYAINILLLLVGTALHLAVLFTLKNIILYQSVALVTVLLRLLIMHFYIRKKFPYLKQYKKSKVKVLLNNSRKDVFVSEIAGVVIDSTDLLVLSIFEGLVSASIYSVYFFVVAGLANVLSSCREAVFAGIGKTYYVDKEEFKKEMDGFESVYMFLAFFLYSTAVLLFRPFIEIYTAGMDAEYYYAFFPILFILMKLLVNLRIPSIVAINAAGHFKQVKYFAVIEAIINLTVSLILVQFMGLYGVLIGTIAGALFRTPILIWYANKNIIKRSSLVNLRKILLWLPIFLGCFILSEWKPMSCNTLLGWVGLAIIVAIIMLAVCFIWISIFDRQVLKRLSMIIKSFKKKQEPKKKVLTNETTEGEGE